MSVSVEQMIRDIASIPFTPPEVILAHARPLAVEVERLQDALDEAVKLLAHAMADPEAEITSEEWDQRTIALTRMVRS